MAFREHQILTRLTAEKIDGVETISADEATIGDLTVDNFRLSDTSFEDMRREASASNIESASTRYTFDYDEGTITFDDDARIANERIIYTFQMPHQWSEGSSVLPHFHWWQSGSDLPNWWMKWRKWNNGAAKPASWTEAIRASEGFTYVSGDLGQITLFPTIDMSDITISGFVQVTFGRDTGNVSTLFAGADPLTGGAEFVDFDLHIEIDSFGSNDEFVKGS